MAESSAAVRTDDWWAYTPCQCPRCAQRRADRPPADPSLHDCVECQPGPGIDYLGVRNRRNRAKGERARQRIRLSELLAKAVLTQEEDAELVVLLDAFAQPAIDWDDWGVRPYPWSE